MPYVHGESRPVKPLNFDNVDKAGPKPPPEGIYMGEVVGAEAGANKKGGAMVAMRIQLVSTDDPNIKEGIDRLVFDNINMTDDESKGAFRVVQFCDAAEIAPPKSDAEDELKAWASETVGRKLSLCVKTETFDGKLRGRVDYYGSERPKHAEEGKRIN